MNKPQEVAIEWTNDQKVCVEILTEARVLNNVRIRPPNTCCAVMFVHKEYYALSVLHGAVADRPAAFEIFRVPQASVKPDVVTELFAGLIAAMTKPGTMPSFRGAYPVPPGDTN